MKVGWSVATLDFDELVKLIADGFCQANGIDRARNRVRVGIRCEDYAFTGKPRFTAQVEWKEVE